MVQELRFDGRVVVVTGAGAGLGRTYALLFASRGASVVVNDLGGGKHGDGSSTKCADTVVEIIRKAGGKAVANYDSVLDGEKIIKTAIDAFGRVDVLVNNAGILRDASFLKMTDDAWDAIYNVHLKGAYITTKAAWTYFYKQKYGRVIMTASNSGIYGNFGQANYSTAKLALVGLANTLAIEGAKRNIHTNVIVPTAASRLTEDILPPDFYKQLKPDLIAPVVFWLCHENCTENGSIIESALGWAGKCHIVRSAGCMLRQDIEEGVTPEKVQENWEKITDMSSTKRMDSVQDATMHLADVAQALASGGMSPKEGRMLTSYTNRDVILYALGVGATTQNLSDMRYLYENHENFSVFPTFYVTYGPMACMSTDIIQKAIPNIEVDPSRIFHGEQYFEVVKPAPTEAKVETRFFVQDILDKGKGAVLLLKHETFDVSTGEKLTTGQLSAFLVGAGGFNGPRTSQNLIPTVDPPSRKPDATVSERTGVDQAALYRLSGDMNPLHIDMSVATMAGFKRPILHGLCSLGYAVRHILNTYADGDPSLFKAVKVRFSKPLLPGQTVRTDMWLNGNRVHFQLILVEENLPVISGAYVDLINVRRGSAPAADISAMQNSNMESDAIFTAMKEFVDSHQAEVKKINAVFLYNITSGGKTGAQWTLDLKNGTVKKGQPSGKADATLTLDDKDMVQIALGKLNPQTAFMKGKLKIAGNIMLVQKLKAIMEANKPKL